MLVTRDKSSTATCGHRLPIWTEGYRTQTGYAVCETVDDFFVVPPKPPSLTEYCDFSG